MKGCNKITLCPAELQRAIQHYFRTVLFTKKACPIVKTIRQSSGIDACFEIEVEQDKNLDED